VLFVLISVYMGMLMWTCDAKNGRYCEMRYN